MRPVCRRSSSELRISVCIMLKDAATLSWQGLVKQVLPSKDSCWLSSENGVVMNLSPGEGRMALHYRLLSCPGSAAAAAAVEQLGAALGSRAASAARSRKEQLGSPMQHQQDQQQSSSCSSRQKGHTVITVNTKIVILIKGNAQNINIKN